MATDLGPCEVGQLWALHKERYSHRQITDRVTRGRDGPGPSLTAVADTVRHLLADPSSIGGRASGSGRKRQDSSTANRRWYVQSSDIEVRGKSRPRLFVAGCVQRDA